MARKISTQIINVYDENGNKIPIPAISGPSGLQGPKPIKNIDYWTPEDRKQLAMEFANWTEF